MYTIQSKAKERVIHKGSELFKTEDIMHKTGYKECLIAEDIIAIMDMCKATNNPHLLWFERLLDSHFEGIISHATYKISVGKIEGINNKIKTLRRQAYGYPDDEYFYHKNKHK